MNKFNFSSKADVLAELSSYSELNIPYTLSFTVAAWQARNEGGNPLETIINSFADDELLAVRSSSRREDSCEESGAGAFLSRLNVPCQEGPLTEAVEDVITSYGKPAPDDQVLIQPMIRDVVVSGVIMTRVLADGAPYYVINYDDESGKTDTITGGGKTSKTVYVWRGATESDFDSARLRSFVRLARRLEEICGNDALDIEFCLSGANTLHLLQTRPICARKNWNDADGQASAYMEHVVSFTHDKTGSMPGLFGQRSILGVMPDWNPAEMIGILPRPLASSLYRNLITARVWSYAREAMGYRRMPPAELMVMILGRPYIDVRASFNSFLPADIDPVTGEALVSAWLERLEAHPEFHDKIEFEIAQTMLDFRFEQNMSERYPNLLSSRRREAFRQKLLILTRGFLDASTVGTMSYATDAIIELRGRQFGRPLPGHSHKPAISMLPTLLEECRKFGTIPFSILARHAFAAESLLRSAVSRGAIAPERVAEFKLSLKTISGEMSEEFMDVSQGRRDAQSFMRKYGHLRPGSYDILSPRYADRENLFGSEEINAQITEPAPFILAEEERSSLGRLLAEYELGINADELLEYAGNAITGREMAKFIFTRNLSDILEIIALWGEEIGFDREQLSWIDVHSIINWLNRALPESASTHFGRKIEINKELGAKGSEIKLGYLIRSERDLYVAPQHRAAPNFVGNGFVSAQPRILSANSSCDAELAGKIVCIENADPGFDWIFTRGIAGLITKFGGANSHMAIRCAEYGLPAAIGVGEKLFCDVAGSQKILLNPGQAVLKGFNG